MIQQSIGGPKVDVGGFLVRMGGLGIRWRDPKEDGVIWV